jgi:ABC-type Mn2+/Zn2+ transport system permease subunit
MTWRILFTLLIAIVVATPRFAGAAENQGPTTAAPDPRTAGILNDIDAAAAPSPSKTSTDAAPPVAHPYFTKAQSAWEHWRDLSEFFAPGLATAAAIGIAASVCGVLVLLRREALLALALPQVVAAGAAVALRLGWPTLPPALVAAAAALGYLIITRRRRHSEADAALPALYISGLCLSFLIIAGASAHVEDLKNLFTGIDVAVTPARAWAAVPLLLAAAIVTALTWRRWLLLAQIPAAAELAGAHPARWDALFLGLLSVVLLLGTASQGVVMVLAMLFLPAAAVLPWVRRVPYALLWAVIVSLVMVAAAFVISNSLSWPFSQTAGAVGFTLLLLSQAFALIRR